MVPHFLHSIDDAEVQRLVLAHVSEPPLGGEGAVRRRDGALRLRLRLTAGPQEQSLHQGPLDQVQERLRTHRRRAQRQRAVKERMDDADDGVRVCVRITRGGRK